MSCQPQLFANAARLRADSGVTGVLGRPPAPVSGGVAMEEGAAAAPPPGHRVYSLLLPPIRNTPWLPNRRKNPASPLLAGAKNCGLASCDASYLSPVKLAGIFAISRRGS